MTAIGLLLRQRLTRLAILAIAIVQVAAFVAPHTGGFSGASATRPHLHAVGDVLEFVHDEAACPACSGVHFATRTTAAAQIEFSPATVLAIPQPEFQTFHSAAQHRIALSRAPPAIV